MLRCPGCRAPVRKEALDLATLADCPVCHSSIGAIAYPAVLAARLKDRAVQAREAVAGESGCFFHPEKSAEVSCDGCGRFLCSLCDIDFRGEHFCPSCISSGQRKRTRTDLENSRTLHDSIALGLALLPIILFWPGTLLTAPLALFWTVRHWNAPGSLVRGRRWRFIVAAVFAVLEIGAWGTLFVFLIDR